MTATQGVKNTKCERVVRGVVGVRECIIKHEEERLPASSRSRIRVCGSYSHWLLLHTSV